MARPIRIEFAGALYHVMARGNQGQRFCRDDTDRKLWLQREALAGTPKGQAQKQVLAWWLHGRTTVKRRWIAKRLAMGYESRVSQAVRWAGESRAKAVMAMKRKLQDYDT